MISRLDAALARLDRLAARLDAAADIGRRECDELAVEVALVRAELEEARGDLNETTRSRERFLAVLSHELRTPLNAILGWTTLLRQRMLQGEAAERALAVIERNARAQARYLNDLLDVWRLTDGRVHVELRPVDLDRVLAEGVEACRPEFEAARVAVDVHVGPCCRVVGDEYRLQQVVTHLLLNAARFTPEGGRVDVMLRQQGAQAVLTVRDTGEGLDRDQLAHVFDRFWQADPRRAARGGGGLGVGLTIAKQLVELHGGTIEGESEGPGRGATFSVRLPVARETCGIEPVSRSASGNARRRARNRSPDPVSRA